MTSDFINDLKQIVRQARGRAYASINYAQVASNWLLGQRIVEEEQAGKARAEYGKHIIESASKALTEEFGKGYSVTNLKSFRKFYIEFQYLAIGQTVSAQSDVSIQQTVSALLSWSHYERLMRVENLQARKWYEQEAKEQMWGRRTLERNINTLYYERMLMSQVKEPVVQEMEEKTKDFQHDKLEFIKNPTVLEFLGLPGNMSYREQELEKAILDNLQEFLMEMGKGFAFVGRQELIRTDTEDYYIDLVFFNYLLNCFVLPVVVSKEFQQELFDTVKANPKAEVRVDVPNQTVTNLTTSHSETFDINGYKKYCLMNALDDIDFLLENKDKISAFEMAHR